MWNPSNKEASIADADSCGNTVNVKLEREMDIAVGLFISLLNVVEIVMIMRRKKRSIYELLLLSLSVSDCMFGLSNAIIASIYLSNLCHSEIFIEVSYGSYLFFVLTSIFHLAFIAFDRFMAVVKPFTHRSVFTKKFLYITIVLGWCVTLMISIALCIHYELNENVPEKTQINSDTSIDYLRLNNKSNHHKTTDEIRSIKLKNDIHWTLAICIGMIDFLMLLSYGSIAYFVSMENRRNRLNVISENTNRNHVPILCLAIAIIFIMLTSPFVITKIVTGKIPPWAILALVANSGINSVVYFFRGKIDRYQKEQKKKHKSTVKRSLKSNSFVALTPSFRLKYIKLSNDNYNKEDANM